MVTLDETIATLCPNFQSPLLTVCYCSKQIPKIQKSWITNHVLPLVAYPSMLMLVSILEVSILT